MFHTLESEYEQWKHRQLAERYAYVEASVTYFNVIYNGQGCKMPILAVVGIATTGEREVLAFRIGDRANEQAWKDLKEDLKERGVKEIGLWESRWQPSHVERHHEEISHLCSTALYGAQNGQYAQLHS